MQYKVIPTEFKKKGFNYHQLKREGNLAIFQQTRKGSSINNYEVVKLGRHNGYQMGGVFIEPAETYPGSSLWGITGWTCASIDSALMRYNQLKANKEAIEQPVTDAPCLPIDPSKIVTEPVPAG